MNISSASDGVSSWPAPAGWSLKKRLGHLIFETHPGWPQRFDALLLVVIALSILVVLFESVDSLASGYGSALRIAEWVFTSLFTVEYLVRVWVARKRRRYIFSFFGVVDLLSLLPTYLSLVFAGLHSLLVIRVLRLLRVFRIFKLLRMISEASALGTALRASVAKIAIFIGVVMIIVVVVGAAMQLVEGPEHGFTSIPTSIYWAIVTLTTVGYGDIAPATVVGQSLAATLMILGYGVIAVPTGIISAELVSQRTGVATICPDCGLDQHADDAGFCRACGARLALSTPADSRATPRTRSETLPCPDAPGTIGAPGSRPSPRCELGGDVAPLEPVESESGPKQMHRRDDPYSYSCSCHREAFAKRAECRGVSQIRCD